MIPVEGHKHLYRDEKSGAIINTDSQGYSQYKKSKNIKLSQKEEIDSMKKDIEEIKNLKDIVNSNDQEQAPGVKEKAKLKLDFWEIY